MIAPQPDFPFVAECFNLFGDREECAPETTMRIKAISLWQPWATLVAIRAKQFETRSWPTNYRGPLAIHAAQRWTREQRELCETEPFKSALTGYLPFGRIVAVCNLVDCCTTDSIAAFGISPNELAFGDWTHGRFAWELTLVRQIQPIPCTGRQGFFTVEISVPQPEAERNDATGSLLEWAERKEQKCHTGNQ